MGFNQQKMGFDQQKMGFDQTKSSYNGNTMGETVDTSCFALDQIISRDVTGMMGLRGRIPKWPYDNMIL